MARNMQAKDRLDQIVGHVLPATGRFLEGIGWNPSCVAAHRPERSVYIVAAKRTPIGSSGGNLADVTATSLGSAVVRSCMETANIDFGDVQECIMGNVLSAGLGQAPARQVAIGAGLPASTCCTTVNKVCASGLKAITLAAQSVEMGHADVVVAGGMESMSNVPYYIPGQARVGRGLRHGDQKLLDGVVFDGLTDPWNFQAMGAYGDLCAQEQGISRKHQDEFAVRSYKRARDAQQLGTFSVEITPICLPSRTPSRASKHIEVDEEVNRGQIDAFEHLRPAFGKSGTVTAASSSKISDGAAAVVLASGAKINNTALRPLARVVAFADAEQEPEFFTTSPAVAIRLALARARLTVKDIDAWEINEAFAVVVLANVKILDIDMNKVNVFGGACALGHPIGCSGARIVVTLCTALAERQGRFGVAAICNGGGGASALVIEWCG